MFYSFLKNIPKSKSVRSVKIEISDCAVTMKG